MKAELIINNIKCELGHQQLDIISCCLDDSARSKDIYHELAKSPSTETKSNIVSQDYLHRKTVKLLLSDSQIDIMRSMITRNKFISQMGKVDIERFIDTSDTEILKGMANNIKKLTVICEKDWLCEKLFNQKDPTVRYKLASNDDTSEFILKKLIDDPDINISQAARDSLDEIEEEDLDDLDDLDDLLDDDDDDDDDFL